MNSIHETAIVSPKAKIGKDNLIGPHVFIGSGVEIGDCNLIEGFSSIGKAAEHRDYFYNYEGRVVIGNKNVIREFVTINASTTGLTEMGDRCVMLRGSHLSHDSILEDGVTVSCNVLIGGESMIMKGANLGLGCIIHQRQVIGSYCMIGMGTVITKKQIIFPGAVFAGNPARFVKKNLIGMERAKVTDDQFKKEWERYENIKSRRS